MKIDIEGHEASALSIAGADRIFSDPQRRPPVIFAELYYCQANDCQRSAPFGDVMFGRGYTALRVPIQTNEVLEKGEVSIRTSKNFGELVSKKVTNIVFLDEGKVNLQIL